MQIKVIFNFGNKVNTIILIFDFKFNFKTQSININTQKIDDFALKIYNIISTEFLIKDELGKIQFFKIFLLINIMIEVILKLYFLNLSNIKI